MKQLMVIALSSFLLFIKLTQSSIALEAKITFPEPTDAATLQFATNLPDDMLVKVAISDGSGTIMCEGHTKCSKGVIKDPAMNGCIEELKAGAYLLEITSEYANFQPEQVRAIIGERGEHLHGELVMKRMLGTRVWTTQPLVVDQGGRLRCRLH